VRQLFNTPTSTSNEGFYDVCTWLSGFVSAKQCCGFESERIQTFLLDPNINKEYGFRYRHFTSTACQIKDLNEKKHMFTLLQNFFVVVLITLAALLKLKGNFCVMCVKLSAGRIRIGKKIFCSESK
jgi:hypothetical protein